MSERLRILIVEDNPADADFIRKLLPQSGPLNFLVESVPRLSEAITRLKGKDIDLILLNLGLPDSQGLQTLHTLQKTAPDIPVIVLTGNDEQELAIAAVRDGAQDYLIKQQVGGSLLVHTIRYAVERKQAERRLQMFQFATDQADDAVFWMDCHAGFYYVNDQACRSLGYTRDELMRLRLFDIDPAYPEERWKANWAQFHEKRIEVERLESFHRRKDGVVFPIEVVGKHCWFGDTELHVAYVRNITERKRTEQAVEESRQILRSVLDTIPVRVFWKDLEGRLMGCNHPFARDAGFDSPEALVGKDDHSMAWKDQADLYRADDQKVIASGVPKLYYEEPQTRPPGKQLWLRTSKIPLRDLEGRIVGVLGAYEDITERKQTEEALLESKDYLEKIINSVGDPIFVKDRQHRFVLVNEAQCRLAGHTREELVGKTDYDFFPKQQVDVFWQNDELVFKTGQANANEETITNAAGELRTILTMKSRFINPSGQIFIVGVIRDITERKQAEERLREQAALLDAANDGIYVRALDHTVTFWNDGAERLYGWTRTEALGRKIPDLGNLGHEAYEAAHAMLLKQGRWSGELKKKIKAGKEIIVFCRWTLLYDEQGRPKEVLAINTDITEQKKLEANFLRAQRMEGIGSLASGIAHDLNNILQPILMTAPLLRETTSDPENREMLDTIENCAQRGAAIIKQLLTFARGTPDVQVPLPVRHFMCDMEKIIRETFPRNIQLSINAPQDLWPVMGDATQIHQALINLCVNARDAMPDGGMLTLAAENLTLDEAFAAMIPNAKPGLYVCVSVADTGMGIPSKNLDRIFDPFFTTKEVGKGTGLGLATVLGIVRGHGGCVRVNSRVGKGTTFELYLPASPEAKAAAPSETGTLPPRAGGELILVVDDEADVRSVVRRTLEKHGYRVVAAAEGAEAMVIFSRHRAEIQAVLTDMMMPGMDGVSLIQALRQLELQLPILGMTGVGEKADIKDLETLGLLALLTKPFDIAELLDVLHQALATAHKAKGWRPV